MAVLTLENTLVRRIGAVRSFLDKIVGTEQFAKMDFYRVVSVVVKENDSRMDPSRRVPLHFVALPPWTALD